MVLKPDKGPKDKELLTVDWLQFVDYYNSLDQLFNDPTKFEVLSEDPTLHDLSTIQRYLNTLEFEGWKNKQMRPKFAQIGRELGLPKIHIFFKYHLFDQLLTRPTRLVTVSANF